MCTLSCIPSEAGYLVGMNRDERFSRTRSLPPEIFDNAIYPHEPSGGTWLAVNTNGLTLAVLNRNEDGPLPAKQRSRGELIPAMIASECLADVQRHLVAFDIRGMYPFRLVAISQHDREICEWQWGTKLNRLNFEWQPRHWYSSGISDLEANRGRSAVVQEAWKDPDAGSIPWLRRLHRSHVPQPGAYSICVHRSDAASVSYSEIEVTSSGVDFRYASGSPCEAEGFTSEKRLAFSAAVGS
jgi:hypothetical protein